MKKRVFNSLFFIYIPMIKKWIEFIKESKKDIENLKGETWTLTEEYVTLLLVDLFDEDYQIDVEFGFAKESYVPKGYVPRCDFTKCIKAEEDMTPAIDITISYDNKVGNNDVSDCLKTMYDYVVSEGYTIYLSDSKGYFTNIEDFEVKGGIFYEEGESESEVRDYLKLLVVQNNKISFTELELKTYYNWNSCEVESENLYVEISLRDLYGILIKDKSYLDILEDGHANWSYNSSDYLPDLVSLFQYYLDSENEKDLVRIIIKNHDLDYPFLKGLSEDEIINFLLKERFYKTLKEIIMNTDSEAYHEVSDTYSDWSSSAHEEQNIKELQDEFNKIVSKEFVYDNFIKGEQQYYKLYFDNNWIDDQDYEDLFNSSLYEIVYDWSRNCISYYELRPNFSDYGDVDSVAFNKDVKLILKNYL